jgi:uncharacterized membrane protein
MRYTTRQITQAAVIAAAYLVLTFVFAPISFFALQFRVSESLMLLAAITPTAIPGLFLGCLISNIISGGLGMVDIIFGSLATLLAAILTYLLSLRIPPKLQKIKLGLLPLPTILLNGIIVGTYLPFLLTDFKSSTESLVFIFATSIGLVMLGELVVTYVLGIPLYLGIKRTKIFRSDEGL